MKRSKKPYSPNYGFCYVNNPKCGSSALLNAINKCLESQNHIYFHMFNTYNLASLLLKPIKKSNVPIFTFVRNPYTRILSAYLEKFEHPKACIKFKHYVKYHSPLAYQNISFENFTFEDFVNCITKDTPHKMNPHWRPQYLLLKLEHIHYDFIGRVENIKQDLSSLLSPIFSDVSIKMENTTHAQDNLYKYYTPKLAQKIYDVYHKDFELLGYHKALDKTNTYLPSIKLPNNALQLKKCSRLMLCLLYMLDLNKKLAFKTRFHKLIYKLGQ